MELELINPKDIELNIEPFYERLKLLADEGIDKYKIDKVINELIEDRAQLWIMKDEKPKLLIITQAFKNKSFRWLFVVGDDLDYFIKNYHDIILKSAKEIGCNRVDTYVRPIIYKKWLKKKGYNFVGKISEESWYIEKDLD